VLAPGAEALEPAFGLDHVAAAVEVADGVAEEVLVPGGDGAVGPALGFEAAGGLDDLLEHVAVGGDEVRVGGDEVEADLALVDVEVVEVHVAEAPEVLHGLEDDAVGVEEVEGVRVVEVDLHAPDVGAA
jgi:hypothetical protein